MGCATRKSRTGQSVLGFSEGVCSRLRTPWCGLCAHTRRYPFGEVAGCRGRRSCPIDTHTRVKGATTWWGSVVVVLLLSVLCLDTVLCSRALHNSLIWVLLLHVRDIALEDKSDPVVGCKGTVCVKPIRSCTSALQDQVRGYPIRFPPLTDACEGGGNTARNPGSISFQHM